MICDKEFNFLKRSCGDVKCEHHWNKPTCNPKNCDIHCSVYSIDQFKSWVHWFDPYHKFSTSALLLMLDDPTSGIYCFVTEINNK